MPYALALSVALVLALAAARPAVAALPGALTPPAPFPLVTGSSVEREFVAPGVWRATYRLATSSGPLVVSVVDADLREPTVRLGTVLAHDTVVSKDEPVSSMARRTGAVAGINGDYFDINGTGAPVGVLVRNGALDRSPSGRVALTVTRDRNVRFENYRFAGSVTAGLVQVPVAAVNVWPPQSGASLLTPSFGVPPPTANVTVLELAPLAPDASGAPHYRVASVAQAPPFPASATLRLAYGAAAQAFGPTPDVGDVVSLSYDTDPPLAAISAAIGGGPELLRGGAPIDDPASPNYADRDRRIPAAAAARLGDGTLALVVIDGRHPAISVGVNRAELIAVLRGLGATDAMLFDSGGSATLVARVLGDADPSVVNEPSDGLERPVADGLFVYSDAPAGPPARLVVRPARIVALPGARVPLRARKVDAAGHGLGDARGPWRIADAASGTAIDGDDVLHVGVPGARPLHLERDGVATDVPVDVVDRVARVVIGPPRANPDPNGTVMLTALAFDDRDRPVAVDGLVRWRATGGNIDPRGRLVAGTRDVAVTATAGGVSTTATIPVGRHAVPLPLFDDAHSAAWKLTTAPVNGPGSATVMGNALQLAYDFTTGGRAAYAIADAPVGAPLALRCAVDGDGNGAALRATMVDRYGDRETMTFARTIDFTGTRTIAARVPPSLAPPLRLHAFYVVGTVANPPITTAGTIGVHDCSADVAGSGNVPGNPAP